MNKAKGYMLTGSDMSLLEEALGERISRLADGGERERADELIELRDRLEAQEQEHHSRTQEAKREGWEPISVVLNLSPYALPVLYHAAHNASFYNLARELDKHLKRR